MEDNICSHPNHLAFCPGMLGLTFRSISCFLSKYNAKKGYGPLENHFTRDIRK